MVKIKTLKSSKHHVLENLTHCPSLCFGTILGMQPATLLERASNKSASYEFCEFTKTELHSTCFPVKLSKAPFSQYIFRWVLL